MKKIAYIVLIALAWTIQAKAQQSKTPQKQVTTINKFEYKDDSVYLDISVDISNLKISSKESIVFEPTMAKAQQKLSLPTIVVRGRSNAKSYNRVHKLNNKEKIKEFEELYKTPNQIVGLYGKNRNPQIVTYHYSIPYQLWMVNSEIFLNCTANSCGHSYLKGIERPDQYLEINIPPVNKLLSKPRVNLIKPDPVAVKRREIQYSSALTFKVNSSVIDPALGDNRKELNSISEMMQSVLGDSDFTITAVNIIGYASPEGTLKSNQILSEKRATALENILKKQYSLSSSLYNVVFGGENWVDLVPMVKNSTLTEKDQILEIIEGVSIEQGRETKLMKLNGGVPYKYLLKNFFPSLRKVIVDLEYNIDAYDLVRIEELIDVKPENLSLEEMYRLSETYQIESNEFTKVFLTAAKVYPNDEIAVHNALASEIIAGDVVGASEFAPRLNEQSQSSEILNTLGAYYLMSEEYQKSSELLQKAASMGNEDAAYNLVELEKKIENKKQVEENKRLLEKVYGTAVN